jgi:hypothetical protein
MGFFDDVVVSRFQHRKKINKGVKHGYVFVKYDIYLQNLTKLVACNFNAI